MADEDYLATPDPEDNGPVGTAGDFGKTLAAGALDVGSNLAALSRYAFEAGKSQHGAEISSALQNLFGGSAEDIRDTMNPATRELAASTLTSQQFWEHPVLAASLKATGMAPAAAALAIPGGLFADATAATLAVAAAGGAVNAGSGLDEFYKQLDAMSDEDLQKQSPKYAALRQVLDEKSARAKFNREVQGMGPAINAVLGAAAGAIGPASTVARGLAGGAENAVVGAGERGALASAGIGAAEGAVGNAAQSGVSDATQQQAQVEAGLQKEFDRARTANAALEGGALGGLLGGAVGLVAGGGAHSQPEAADVIASSAKPSVEPPEKVTTSDVAAPQPQVGRASAAPAKPADIKPPNPQNEPTGSGRDGAKKPINTKVKDNAPPASVPVDPAVSAAIKSNDEGQNTATATELAALKTPTPNETIDKLNQEKPVTPPSNTTPTQLDTGQNVPEQAASIKEQIAQIGTGDRKAVMLPTGTVVPGAIVRPGLKTTKTQRGRFIYDPKLTSVGEIQKLSRLGRENELLGLGPVSKPEAVARVAAGETPTAVVERTPEGTEVKAAGGTDQTAPAQVASLEANKTPGNVISVESPTDTVVKRMLPSSPEGGPKRTGRILPNLTQTAETVPLSDFNKNRVEAPKEPKGKNYSEKERAAVDEKLAKAQAITDIHAPQAHEQDYMRSPEARDAVIRRAQAMIEDADKQGVKIQSQLKKSTKGDAPSDHPSMQILRAAKDLTKVAAKRKAGREITEATSKFAEAERLIRAGHSEEVLAQRRIEGDEKMRRGASGEEVAAATTDTPESELAKKEGAEVVSTEEANAPPEGKLDVEKDQVKTAVQGSAKGEVRGVSAPTEERVVRNKAGQVEKVEVAKAASVGRVFTPEERAAAAARYNTGPKKKVSEVVNLNPTEGQKLAGNYKKGHRRVDGMDFTIENPRGAIRRGVDEHGEPWEVRMPADYGYIRGTEGADGDHVDAYDLRSGKRHFVVDQLDHRTGEFDEHKLILRAKDEAEATDTYRRAFSDGKGDARLGYVHEVSAPELRDWLKKGDTTAPHIEHIAGEESVYSPPEESVSDHLTTPSGERVRAERSDFLSNEISRFDFSKMQGVGGVLARFFQSRLQKLADDSHTTVHFVSPENMRRLFPPRKPGEELPLGYHNIDNTGVSHIVVRNDVPDRGIEHGSLAHVLMHEAIHSVTVRELESSPAFNSVVRQLMRISADWMEHPDNAPHVELLYGDSTRYAFTNAKEFVAEAFSNARFQEVLTQIPINDPRLAAYLGLNKRSMSMWDVFRGYVKKAVEKVTGRLPQFDSVLDAMMRVGEHTFAMHREQFIEGGRKYQPAEKAHALVQGEALRMADRASEKVKKFVARESSMDSSPKLLKLRTFDNLADIAKHFFGESNPVRTIHEAIERMRVRGQQLFEKSEPLVRRLVTLRAANARQFTEFSSLLHDATVANVHPDVSLSDAKNAHLGKNRIVGEAQWSKAQHPELAKRYNALVKANPQYATMWRDVVKHYTDTQNKMTLGIINNQILKLLGINDAHLADRIHNDTLTDSDKSLLGSNLDVIQNASELSKIEGPYVPLMRRGDHVVKADRKVTQPGNTKKISENEFEFKDDKAAVDYIKNSDLKATLKKVWVDEKTGELNQTDPKTGAVHKMSAQDLDAVPRYRVEVHNRHVEFVQGKRAAYARAAELAKDSTLSVHNVVPRAYEPGARQGAELSTSLTALVRKLEHSDAYKTATPTQQAQLRRAIEEAALASHGSTRVSSRALPRRGVQGYSEDLVQNTVDYANSSSRYLAKLEHSAALEDGLKEMKETLDRDHSKVGQYARTAISNEVLSRVNGDNGFQQGGKLAPVVKRALAISFVDKLGSPAYSVINAMQPGMVTVPYLGGRHGIGRAFAALGKAYADINSAKIVAQGLKETGRRIKGQRAPEDFITSIRKNLSPDENRMIDAHLELGTIDPSAGLEINELVRDTKGIGGRIDAGIGYLEGVTREMPRAIEAINRAVTAIAAYRLEKARGASHEQAVQYSKDAVNQTQFNYSPTNSPALFNHPLLKIALQFKKYGQGMYQLMGTQIANAIRNEKPGDRAQAVKTLITLAGTHMAIAGALGLPTEPFKYLLMGAHAAGLTSMTWGDVEHRVRQAAAAAFGNTAGEVLTKGLPHLLNIDMGRAGLDSITSFGEPKSDKESDVKTWLFDSLAGPVVSLGGDWIKGLNQITNGQYEKAAENLIPLKAASDSLRAYRQATEGKKSATGKQTMTPYSGYETALRVAGFGSAREEETGAAAGAFYRNSARQKEERSDLVNAWSKAPPSGKASAWAAIQKWNTGQPKDVRIAPKELTDKAKRDATTAKSAVRGITANKRDKRFLAEGSIYNTR